MRRQLAAILRSQRQRRVWRRIFSVLACIVVFCTTYALILPAITLENPAVLDCSYEVHEHNEACYDEAGNIVCGQADYAVHIHSDECYNADGDLICPLPEIPEHEHTEDCWSAETVTVCGFEEHEHTDECLVTELVLTCEEEHEHTEECYEEVTSVGCGMEAHTHTEDCYAEAKVLTCGKIEAKLHTHTEDCYDDTGALTCGELETQAHTHTEACYRTVSLTAENKDVYTYEDDTIAAEVTLADGAALPEGAELAVTPITGLTVYSEDGEAGTDSNYEELVRQAEEAVGQSAAEILLYDISFYTTEGEYLPVEDTATVSLRFKETMFSEGTEGVTVLHYAEDGDLPVTLESVDVERDENDAPAALTFQTDGFSVFAVVTVTDGGYERITDVENLDGKSVAILSNGAKYAMMAEKNSDGKGRKAEPVTSTADLSGYTFWTFEKNTDENYYISSNGNYLVMGAQTLTTTTTKGNATKFSITITDGLAEISASVNGTTYYINLFGGESNQSGFKSYSRDSTNLQQLYVKKDETENGVPFIGLDGKSYVIANLNTTARQYAINSGHKDNTYLSASQVSVIPTDETTYVYGDNLTTWTFTATNTPGVYYIQADDTKQYLSLTSGTLTTSDTPNAITVTTSSTYPGQVRLSANNTAVDWHGGSNANNLVFGAYSGSNKNDYQTLCEPLDASAGVLFYDLNVPSMSSKGTGWKNEPTIVNTIQEITDDTTALYAQPAGYYKEAGVAGIENLYRFNVGVVDELDSSEAWNDGFGEEWYGEERFDGWTYKDEENDITYLFAPNTAITKNDSGELTVTAEKKITEGNDGNDVIEELEEPVTITLPGGAVLTGHWTEVSNVAIFFVNYKGTILDTEGDVEGRRSDTFTRSVAIGHVFYGKLKVGDDQVFGSGANSQISGSLAADFTQQFNPDNPKTQIVIEYLRICTKESPDGTDYDTSMKYKYHGANNNVVVENTLLLLKQTGRTIQVATGNGLNPTIDNSLCDGDHYEIRWYVMKEQTDAWHIDGVLVAKTAEITVSKTFSGLTEEQVGGLLNKDSNDGFNMPVKLGENRQPYITMTTQSVQGQYKYIGQEQKGEQSYTWSFNAITDEQYTLSEDKYTLSDYDVSSVVVHYYKDESGNTVYESASNDTTENMSQAVIGGKTTAVSFNNFYTPTGTGAFAIHKSSSTSSDIGAALQGAEFTLYNEDGTTEATSTTNSRGSAYFNNLEPDTYILKETKAPDGYIENDDTWTVVVENKDGNIVVTVYENEQNGDAQDEGTVCYDGGVTKSYQITNIPKAGTVRVTKTFEGITMEEMDALVEDNYKEGNGYYIKFQGPIGGVIDAEGDTYAELYLKDASRSQDGFTFTWMVTNLAMGTTEEPVFYEISEHNYKLSNYIDTVVTAVVNGTTWENKEIDRVIGGGPVAYFNNVTFESEESDTVLLTNRYTNTFELSLQKVDSVTKKPLPGAEFDIYGGFSEAADPSKRITYTNPETGEITTYYYIKTITSGENGVATGYDLNLSDGSIAFVYILDESTAPNGYMPGTPQIINVDVTSPKYLDGVFSIEAPNTKEEDYVHAEIDTSKVWMPNANAPPGEKVTLELYRVTHDVRNEALPDIANAEFVKSIELNGTVDKKPSDGEYDDDTPSIDKVQVYESSPWVATWMNLYSASKDYTEDNQKHYHYFVREITEINGYVTSYACYDKNNVTPEGWEQTLRITNADGTTTKITGYLIADMDEAYKVTITNTETYELPETGGVGGIWYTIGGTLLTAGSLLVGFRLRRKRERRYN